VTDHLLDRLTVAVGKQYLIEGEIGRGGMAVVYRAVDLRLHRPVAIKVLPPELAFNPDVRMRFIREAQTAAQLSHPNIVPIYSVDEKDGIVYFVMSLVDGESVGARLVREGAWPADRVAPVLRDVADALSYAHERGVIHRDIKPDNILIDRASGRPLVTDFGIARAVVGETRITATGVAVGTPAYMSPEQAVGEREIDGRSDLYSLGVVGYQMLAGETPFKASNTPAMLVKHVSERPRPVREMRPDCPAYLAVAIDRALAKRPDDRWSSAAELRNALAGALASERPNRRESLPPIAPPPRPAPPVLAPFEHQRLEHQRAVDHQRALEAQRPSEPPLSRPPDFPLPPVGLSRQELKRWHRMQARMMSDYVRRTRAHEYDDRPLEQRVIAFRRSLVRFALVSPMLLAVNAATQGVPWFLVPTAFMLFDTFRKGGSIWSDGIGPIDAFRKGIRARLRGQALPSASTPNPGAALSSSAAIAPMPAPTPADPAAFAPREVLASRYGEYVRQAAADRALVRDIIAGLRTVEREMIPDVTPTVDALAQRVGGLSTTLHRLDADVSGSSLGALDERIAALKAEAESLDRERRLSLLERQRASLNDLLERRRSLVAQLESAALALQNLKYDLLKLRSSGIAAALDDVTSATQEARALSRDIGHVLEAADDLRRI
jgi:serine/threonine-protein kinase